MNIGTREEYVGRNPIASGRLTVGLAALALMVLGFGPAGAVDRGQIRLGSDYDIFVIGGDDFRPCQRACEEDARCKSWTFLTALGQCRLKHSVAPAAPNNCCVSDVKREKSDRASQDELACSDFAEAAVAASNRNRSGQCGYRGPLWSIDYRELYNRCLENSPRRRDAEAAERKEAIADCVQISSRGQNLRCDHFARMGVEQAKSNDLNKCGLPRDSWKSDIAFYQAWCKRLGPSESSDVIVSRESRLLRCLSRGGGEVNANCQRVAEVLVGQGRQAQARNCGPAYAGYHVDFEKYYEMCSTAEPGQPEAWIASRNKGLEECGDRRKRLPKLILKF